MPVFRKVICPSCRATNMGVHERCMLCQAPLPAFDSNATPAAAPEAHAPSPAVAAVAERVVLAEPMTIDPPPALAEPEVVVTPAAVAEPEPVESLTAIEPEPVVPSHATTELVRDEMKAAVERECTHCGASLAEGMRFCIECGTPADAEPEAAAPAPTVVATRTCSKCEAELAEGARFCINCGTPVAA